MDSRIYWIGVAALVGVGLIVPIQAEEGSLDVATFHRASNVCAVLSAFESAAATPLTVTGANARGAAVRGAGTTGADARGMAGSVRHQRQRARYLC